MYNYIVLVKQIPDINKITENSFDSETGTLIRSRLSNVINDLDSKALGFANYMKKISNDSDAKIICLSMGPLIAEEILKYCLSRHADEAILLTDKSFSGADTIATANPLAFAIRKIVREILNSNDNYFVVSGMQSADGDTAQVPAQIAQELDISFIPYATEVRFNENGFQFTRIINNGSQIVSPLKMPALLTVAKYDYPLYPSFSATRRAEKTEIIKWNNSDINATCIGLNGSKTRVIKVFPPLKTARKCQKISDIPELAKLISNIIKNEYPLTSGKKSNTNSGLCTDYKPDPLKVSYKGEIGVIAEHYDSIINPSTFEMIGKARELADTLNSKVNVFIAGNCIKNMTEELIYSGADNIYIIENKLLKDFEVSLYAKVYSNAIKKTNPQIVLLAATPLGRILAPMISYTLKCGLTADCTELSIGDIPGFNLFGVLIQTRPALGGNVMATICTKDSPLQMATARPGIMKRFPPNPLRKGMMIKLDADIRDKDIRLNIIKTETANEKIDFNVELIVSCGKGVKNKKNFDNITQSFCKTISEKFNIRVEKGGSRAAVEHGYIDRIYQIGQTGTAVSPKIYFALGISGAIQHMIAINNAENIIAINKDPDASIFKQCDYYYIGNVEEVIPTLIKYLIKE